MCIHTRVHTWGHVRALDATYEVRRAQFPPGVRRAAPGKEIHPREEAMRRRDRGELAVTNAPRQNSRPRILPVKRGHFLPAYNPPLCLSNYNFI